MLSVLIPVAFLATFASAKLPPNWKSCRQTNQVDRDACLVPVIEEALLDLMKGNRQLGVLPMEPMRFNHIEIEGKGSVAINLTFTDIDLINLSSLKVQKVESDWDKGTINFDLSFSKPFYLIGHYEISGKVLILPITGNGNCNLTLVDLVAPLKFSGHIITRNNKKYFQVDDCSVTLKTPNFILFFDNLFNGQKALGDNMNKFLNENSELILEEMGVPISKAFGEGFKTVANRVFEKIPLNEIVP